MNNEAKSIAPKLVEIIAKEIALQAKAAKSTDNISIKATKEKFVKTLLDEINKALPDR
jgi:hypothetical protein